MRNGNLQWSGRKIGTYARLAVACGALLVLAPAGGSRAFGDTNASMALPAHVVRGAFGATEPEAGYEWTTTAHTAVRWASGKTNDKYPHVTSTAREGFWTPDSGYTFVATNDIVVKWTPGVENREHPHVIASAKEGEWHAAEGYQWLNNVPGDLRVVKAGPTEAEIQEAADRVNQLERELKAVNDAMVEAEAEYNVAYLGYLATDDGSYAEDFAKGYMVGVKIRYENLSSRRQDILSDLRDARNRYNDMRR